MPRDVHNQFTLQASSYSQNIIHSNRQPFNIWSGKTHLQVITTHEINQPLISLLNQPFNVCRHPTSQPNTYFSYELNLCSLEKDAHENDLIIRQKQINKALKYNIK